MKKFNQEGMNKIGTFEENFYLACLLYPQNLKKNLNIFLQEKEIQTVKKSKEEYLEIIQKVYSTLYKYSSHKLNYFTSKPEIAFLFCYYYEKGAGQEKKNKNFVEEFEIIRQK